MKNSIDWLRSGILLLFCAFTTFYLDAANSTKEVPEIIVKMTSAHGDLEKWRSAPSVSFEDHFRGAGQKATTVSQVTVEQGRRRAYLDFPDSKSRIAWDGKQAWSENWKAPFPPRFMALLNYYFLNIPWLSRDRGVNFSQPGKGKLWKDPIEYTTVKMTFDTGVGDTPEDYYILYIDPKSNQLKAYEYIATYSSILPPGEKSTPPSILVYDELATVDGFLVPTKYSIYDKNRKLAATCEIKNWSFKKKFDNSRMTMPAGAVIDTSKPRQ